MAYKTPGVYIVEKNAFPNSVVEVATAVPAFIGYTERADNKGVTLKGKPWRISSLSQFIDYYGGPPRQAFTLAASAPEPAEGALPRDADFQLPTPGATDGGKTPYWISQDKGGFLLYYSMLLFFQNGGGACYIVSVGSYAEAGGNSAAIDETKLTDGIEALKKEQEPTMVVIPDAVRLGSLGSCTKVQQATLLHCGQVMRNRFAILDVYQGYKPRDDNSGDCVANFRDALGTNHLDFAAAYYPWVNTGVVGESDLDYSNVSNLELLQGLLRQDMRVGPGFPEPVPQIALKSYQAKLKAVDDIAKVWPAELVKAKADAARAEPDPTKKKALEDEAAALLKANEEAAKTDSDAAMDLFAVAKAKVTLHQLLSLNSAAYLAVLGALRQQLNLLPPGAAMAGVYTSIDNTRGVWKAPANVSLNSVISPAVSVSQEEQEDLNVTTAGKSINAIRSFIGEGTLVWGARTLDGNSLDWRYINVRRTMIMLEESLRLATKAYVFEPNVANTWVTIKSMVRNFLTGIWKRGGLAGASPDDAFSIFVGLGETMTPEDILEGLLNVTVLVALSRPAEFIEITFQQQMQKS